MELNSHHRRELISQLNQARNEADLASIKVNQNADNTDMDFYQIHAYLAKEKAILITQALIDNDIDY